MYRLIETIASSTMSTLKQNTYTYMYISGVLINDMSLSTGSKLALRYFLSYITVFPIFCCSLAKPGRSRQTLSAIGVELAESCGKGDRPQLTCSHSADFLLVPAELSVLQPCTHDSSFFSSCNSCGTSWPHNLWATNVFPRHQLDIFSLPLMLDSTIYTFGSVSQPLTVFSFSVSLCLLCTKLPALKSFPKKAQQPQLHDKVSLGFRLFFW